MGVACAKAHPASLKLFKEASAVLGYDLLDLCEKGPQETLNQTDKSQPALLTACMALYTHWKDTTDEPLDFDVCAGLSLGEFTALCFSGALPFKEAVSLTARRGALMQAAAEETPGDMYAILGLSREETEKICANVLEACPGAYCGVANYLCKGNYAVSVSRSAVRTLETFAAAAKAKRCIKLRVAGAFHSPLMAMAAGGLKEALEKTEIQKPQVPIILNVDGQIHSDPQTIKRILLQQLTSPTQWQQSMESLCQRGLKEAIEFGPGGVLSGLMKKINPNVVMKRVE